ncbi:MAG: LysE family translocator [Synergistaceae bacterium]|jgi:threonine/homoserine/homoserine lactone efflux protein|nr:LysE family translocator [Synergistaceae bacterium]
MTLEYMWSVLAFSFGMAATPGPNNTIIFSSGLNYGFFPSLSYMLGVTVGLPLMIVAVAWGLGEFFDAFPAIYEGVRYTGAVYILYLSWKIATARPPEKDDTKEEFSDKRNHRLTFWDAVLLQWTNPKAWILAVTGVATYIGADLPAAKLVFYCGAFAVMSFLSLAGWCLGGVFSGRLIHSPRLYRIMNGVMGLLLAASVISLF